MKSRRDWIKGYLSSSKSQAGGVTMFAAGLTIVMGFASMRLWDPGPGAVPDSERWSAGRVGAEGFRAVSPRSLRPLGQYLLSKDAASKERGDAVKDGVEMTKPTKPLSPLGDVAGPSGLPNLPPGASGGSQGSSGSASSSAAASKPADPKASPASGRVVGLDRRQGEARPFRTGRLNIRTARGFGSIRSSGAGTGVQTGFGGSSTGGSWESVTGPAAATTGSGVSNLSSSGSAAPADLGGFSPLGNGNLGGGGTTGQEEKSDYPAASSSEIHDKQLKTHGDAECLRSQVGLPAVGVLRNMMVGMSDPSSPRTILGAAQAVSGASGASSLNPSIARVREDVAASLVCLQALTLQAGMPEDPPAAEACHQRAETPIQAYQIWPSQLRSINQGPVADALVANPPWNLLDASAQGAPVTWSQKTHATIQDLQDTIAWAHTSKLPSWEPTWEQDVNKAIFYLQLAAGDWDNINLPSSGPTGKGLVLAEGSRNTAAALASLDHAWPQMTGGGGNGGEKHRNQAVDENGSFIDSGDESLPACR